MAVVFLTREDCSKRIRGSSFVYARLHRYAAIDMKSSHSLSIPPKKTFRVKGLERANKKCRLGAGVVGVAGEHWFLI